MDTRKKALKAALKLFAEKGFYGASMDHIAAELGVTKQTLIHHFGTKEKLYGEVLANISNRLLRELPAVGDDTALFEDAVLRMHANTRKHRSQTQLLMRELLDNRRRASRASTWYLRPFLDRLHDLLRLVPGWERASDEEVAVHVYQLMGAINYFAISTSTLENMYSKKHVRAMEANFVDQLRLLVRVRTRP